MAAIFSILNENSPKIMKNYLPNVYIFSSVLIVIVCVAFIIMSISEYYNVAIVQDSLLYPFGSEGPVAGTWQYENKENYITFNAITIILFLVNLLVLTIGLLIKNITLLKWSIIIFVLIFLILHILQANYFKLW